jgi:hypothetical protein
MPVRQNCQKRTNQNLVPLEFRFDPDNWYQIVSEKIIMKTVSTLNGYWHFLCSRRHYGCAGTR